MRKKPSTKKPVVKKSKSTETTFSAEATTLVERADFLEVSTNIHAGAKIGALIVDGAS